MDPNKTLATIRALAADLPHEPIIGNTLDLAEELCEHINALDEWLTKGGFLPTEWDTCTTPTADEVAHLGVNALRDAGFIHSHPSC